MHYVSQEARLQTAALADKGLSDRYIFRLAELLGDQTRRLWIDKNHFGADAFELVARCLPQLTSLRELAVTCDKGAPVASLVSAISASRSLRRVWLLGEGTSDFGKQLAEMLENHGSLVELWCEAKLAPEFAARTQAANHSRDGKMFDAGERNRC
jgi:hypothetical protein